MQRLSWEPESFELHLPQAGQLEAQPSVYSHLSHSLLDPPDFASLRLLWAPASFYRMSMQRLGSIFYSVGRMSQTGQLNSQSELACRTALGVWSYKRYPLGRSELGLLLLYDPLRHSSLPTWRGEKVYKSTKICAKPRRPSFQAIDSSKELVVIFSQFRFPESHSLPFFWQSWGTQTQELTYPNQVINKI